MTGKRATLITTLFVVCGVLLYQWRLAVSKQTALSELNLILEKTESNLAMLRQNEHSERKPPQNAATVGLTVLPTSRPTNPNGPPNRQLASLSWEKDAPYVYLKKAHLKKYSIPAISPENEISPTIMDALGMEEAERESVKAAFAQFVSDFQALERAHITELEDNPGQARFHQGEKSTFLIAAFPDEGLQLKNAFVNSLNASLGSERTEIFMRQADYDFTQNFNEFGKYARRITFVDHQRLDGTTHHRVITDLLNEAGRSISAYSTVSPDGSVPQKFRHLIGEGNADTPVMR